ncbi:hypothetical protein CPB85DRAFT_1281650 [Mucidula mucida]|nr:hypothetical protein CPB85DRAFT_1281650 [Mucidula mucida]
MASYLRSLFGGHSTKKSSSPTPSPSSSSSRESKVHRRSPSANAAYIYTSSGASPVRPNPKRSDSYTAGRSVPPSPLRYNTYDSTTHRTTKGQSLPKRAPLSQSSSYKHEYHIPYPIYASSVSHSGSDSRTNSTTSIHPPSLSSSHSHCVIAPPPRTSSSASVSHDRPPHRPVLKQTHTWHGHAGSAPGAQHPHVSFQNPNRTETLHMHPLLASSRLHSAPISYDVTYTPSPHSVVDRNTRTPVPSHTLAQPATDPPTFSKLVLRCDRLPWSIVVQSSSSKGGKFFIGTAPSALGTSKVPISNQDLLCALHNALSVRVSHEEWEALGKGTRAQRKVTRAYETRCQKMGGGWDGGVRRIDWLGERTRLVGIEVDKDAGAQGVAKLVFGKPSA